MPYRQEWIRSADPEYTQKPREVGESGKLFIVSNFEEEA